MHLSGVVTGERNMLKQLLAGSSILILWCGAYIPVNAQAENPSQSQPAVPQSEVSADELEQFAQVIRQLQAIEQETQLAMVQAIQNEGLSPQEYQEFMQAEQNPEQTVESSQEQQQNFARAREQVDQLQQSAEQQMQQAVEEEVGIERFNELATAIQQDSSLRERVQQILQQ